MNSTYADRISLFDSRDMYNVLRDFPTQIRSGMEIGNTTDLSGIDAGSITAVLICGMGGSAISGDILRVYSAPRGRVPILVNRDYTLPRWVGRTTLVIVMSYSGETEESLSAYAEAREAGAMCIAISSGGSLLELATSDGIPAAVIPSGLAPRCALGYLLLPLLTIAARCELLDIRQSVLTATIADIDEVTRQLADYSDASNTAVRIAERLHNKLPLIYGAQATLDAVVTRWRCQIQENAKTLAYSNVFPEMNHNEIVGWEQHPELLRRIAVIMLYDRDDPERIRRRMSVTHDIIRPHPADILEIHANEDTQLSRIMGLICLGDWVSFYLAIGSGVDPYPIENIDRLKRELRT